jgi:hypothetical protein
MVVLHATAGTNSYAIVKDGVPDAPSTLAQWLVPYEGVPWQFAEADAICYDSPPNDDGPGIEIERPVIGGQVRPGLSEFRPLSASQTEWTGRIVRWLHDEWGVPLDLYDGPRVHGTLPGYHGFANHGDVDRNRTDGVTRAEWDAFGTAAFPDLSDLLKGASMPVIIVSNSGERVLEWPLFTGVSAEDLAAMKAKGVPLIHTTEAVANQLVKASGAFLKPFAD